MKLLQQMNQLVQHCGVRFPTAQGSASLQDSFPLPQRLFSGCLQREPQRLRQVISRSWISAVELITPGSDSIIARDCGCLYGCGGKAIQEFSVRPLIQTREWWGSAEQGVFGSRASSLCFGRCGGEGKSLFVLPFWRCEGGGRPERSKTLLWRRGKEAWFRPFRPPHILGAPTSLSYSEQFLLHLLSLSEFFQVCFLLILGCSPEGCCNISLLIFSASTKKVCLQTLLWPGHLDAVLWTALTKVRLQND